MNAATHRLHLCRDQYRRIVKNPLCFELFYAFTFERPVEEGDYLSLPQVEHDPKWYSGPRPKDYVKALAVVQFYNRDGSPTNFIGLKLQRIDPKPGLI